MMQTVEGRVTAEVLGLGLPTSSYDGNSGSDPVQYSDPDSSLSGSPDSSRYSTSDTLNPKPLHPKPLNPTP